MVHLERETTMQKAQSTYAARNSPRLGAAIARLLAVD
jgi:hypothetical protein